MSEELLNLDGQLLKNEELDVEAHIRRFATDEPAEDEDQDEVEAHVRRKD